ncbi:Exonuclease 3'-5' domain-containing protein 2 isoform X1 [Mycena sanguinolenta]|uniref:Exonuclease 3'-5' domain-containing protein 2 isoform X1 n=1 Tax=Mycena sanguinolenta TaxID=230812 RepID=A0A8H6TUG9_9AGAR|nr:Exonuclease 3'-5' domain-containing protein 2 isoform X1 [Mycena sanguinolenta]
MDNLVAFLLSCCTRRTIQAAPTSSVSTGITPSATPPRPRTPTQPYPTPDYLYIITMQEAEECLSTIQDGAVIGLDIESIQSAGPKLSKAQKRTQLAAQISTKGSFEIDWSQVDICLVQIATEDGRVYMINIRLIAELPAQLRRICESRNILKVSAGIFSDGQRLWDSFRLDLMSVVSLGLVARLAYPTTLLPGMPFANEPGLAVIVGHVLGYRLSKDQQTSAWDAASLSDEQKNYAAIDAHATLSAFCAMYALLQRCEVPVLPAWYTYDIRDRARVKCGTAEAWVAHCSWWSEDVSKGFEARR